jgi:hypothetical protein
MQSATKTYMPNKYHDLLHVNDAMRSWVTTRHNKQLTNIVTYIRIKNILSCLRDLHHAGSTLSKQEARQRAQSYKADNPRLFVRGCGLQLAVMSWLYSALSGAVLSKLIGYIYGGKS